MAIAIHSRFDAADYLDDPETAAEYLAACLEDPNPAVFAAALDDVARAAANVVDARDKPGHDGSI